MTHRRHCRPSAALGVLASLAVAAAAVAGPPQYALRHLGDGTKIEGINDHGEITGWRLSPSPARAFVSGIDRPYELLPLPAGYTASLSWDINDGGVIVGEVLSSSARRAAAWYPDGLGGYTIEVFGTLPGHVHSVAYAINDRGDIVGDSIVPGFEGGPTVWFNAPGGIVDLGPDAPSRATDVNDEGLVVGWGFKMFDLDTMTGSPLPENFPALVWGTNDHGDLCGYTATSSETIAAVRYTEKAGWELLGGSVNQSAEIGAYDINDDHVTVGLMVGGSIHIEGLGLLSLANLLAPEYANWTLNSRYCAINELGQIALTASNQNSQVGGAVVLTPLGTMIIPGDVNGDAWVNLDDHCAWQLAPIDLDGDGDADADDEQWLVDRLAELGFVVADCNANGIGDFCEIANGTSADCDADGVPDECQSDCDADGVPDACEPDCDANGVPDACDIADGAAEDCNGNGIPDPCDVGGTTEATLIHDPPIVMLQNSVIVDEILVLDAGIVDDVDVHLDYRYRIGYTKVELSHGGTTVTILDRPGHPANLFGFVNFGYDADVDDDAGGPFLEDHGDFCCSFETILSPPAYRPNQPLSAFDGMPSEGVWTFTITTTSDFSNGDGLHGWGLTITRAGVDVPPCCDEDVDGSGEVDFTDLLALLGAWGTDDGRADLDGNGTVDFADLLTLLGAWGPCD